MQERSELCECAMDGGMKGGKSQFRNTQIWVFAKLTNLLVLLDRRKFHEFSGLT